MSQRTERSHSVTRAEVAVRYVRRVRAMILAVVVAATIPYFPPVWSVGTALAGALTLDVSLWWFRYRKKGLLSPELANAALNLLPAVFVVLDESGCLRFWNARFASQTGQTSEDMYGRQLYRFFGETERNDVVVAVARGLTRGASTVEARIVEPDGRRTPRLFTFIRVNLGGTYRLIGLGLNIRARKEAEEKLRRQEQRYRMLAENVTDVVIHVNPATRLQFVSRSVTSLLGFQPDELRGTRALDLVHPDDRERCTRAVTEALEEGRRPRPEFRVEAADGEYVWVEAVGKEIDSRDAHRELVITARDISERKAREAELDTVEAAREVAEEARKEAEHANRLKSVFLANMSHEIRTPLTSILGFAEAIGEETEALEDHGVEAPNAGELDRYAGLIEKSGQRLLGTLDSVLNLSKLEAGAMDLSPEPVDLSGEPPDVVRIFEPQANAAGIDLRAEVDDRPVWAKADPDGLHILVRNLVSNALKYTDEGGHVVIRARSESDAAVLEVEDTGVGMDQKKVSELFEAFRQESEGVAREYEGAGLGLAVTKQAVDQMNGQIEVETEKGSGSCFTVRLPIPERTRATAGGENVATTDL